MIAPRTHPSASLPIPQSSIDLWNSDTCVTRQAVLNQARGGKLRHRAKFTEAQIIAYKIRMRDEGAGQWRFDLANEIGVHISTLSQVDAGRTWRDVGCWSVYADEVGKTNAR